MATIYSGPAKIYINSVALFPEGVNGAVRIGLTEETAEIASAMHGRIGEQVLDQIVEVVTKPFDNWGSIPTLFPPRICATVGATPAALLIGTRPHGAVNAPTVVWSPDGRLYTVVRSAVIGHPSLHLGIGKALFGDVRIIGIGDSVSPVAMGASGYLMAGNAITESGGADPGGQMTMADFVRGAWVGVWGAVTGFDAVEAEEEWTIETDAKYSPLKIQGRTVGYKLDSVGYMARVRPYGPTQTQILGQVGEHTHGQRLGSADLVLTGPASKTITLENAEVRGAGFEFGGTTLGTGEIAFVNEMTFTTGVANALITFSA